MITRKFAIGSEWLYFKLYLGRSIADSFLVEQLLPMINSCTKKGLIKNWFFIRYNDPDPHLRIRFQIYDHHHIGVICKIFNDITSELLNDHIIHKVQVDTYIREIERYGSSTMEVSEMIFRSNSEFVIQTISICGEDQELRWLICIRWIDDFLDAFKLNLRDKQNLLKHLKTSFAGEFQADKHARKQLSDKYRRYRSRIDDVILDVNNIEIKNLLLQNKLQNQALALKIIDKYQEKPVDIHLSDLLASYLHMHCNRLFRSKQRLCEWIIYDFLFRSYDSSLARNKKMI
ncbi:thiopeptide-type bacteriocin biosynthesis protein [Christiangramia sp. LLG6405-1]|uniref:thiopeptide-type bacteriocin biosynthesis protein n=1 Tax=Christiangramia sp. LLG6405-1 TaxID=3160832 RepID=UPI00386A3945